MYLSMWSANYTFKTTLRLIALMETIADFAAKPFSSKHLCKYLQVLETVKLFSAQYSFTGSDSEQKLEKQVLFKDYISQGQKPSFQGKGQGLEIGP